MIAHKNLQSHEIQFSGVLTRHTNTVHKSERIKFAAVQHAESASKLLGGEDV